MLTRKIFLAQLAGGGFGWLLAGCGGGGGDDAAPPAAVQCSAFAFTANHGHSMGVAAADLDSSASKTYDIQSGATHNHTVTLTPAQLADLKAGRSVSVVTSPGPDGHTHDVSGTCA